MVGVLVRRIDVGRLLVEVVVHLGLLEYVLANLDLLVDVVVVRGLFDCVAFDLLFVVMVFVVVLVVVQQIAVEYFANVVVNPRLFELVVVIRCFKCRLYRPCCLDFRDRSTDWDFDPF